MLVESYHCFTCCLGGVYVADHDGTPEFEVLLCAGGSRDRTTDRVVAKRIPKLL
jgi:hypothetical protein